ncbi:MAG: RDD family protein [Bacteroidota bacterium]
MNYQSVRPGPRFATMFIDYLIVFFGLGMVCFGILMTLDLSNDLSQWANIELYLRWMMIALLAVWLSKDVFGGQSLAKRATKVQILRQNSDRAADPFQTILRNLSTLFLAPIEFIWGMVNTERRLGDFIAGTRLQAYEGKAPQIETELWRSVAAFFVSLGFCYLLINPLFSGESGRGSDISPEVSSLNTNQSQALEDALEFKMGNVFSDITVEVYDQSQEEEEGFVRVILQRDEGEIMGLSRLYRFRAMIQEIQSQTLEDGGDWPGEMLVQQQTETGSNELKLYW